MCTLAVLWRATEVAPLVVAQCRDEALARPALDVARWRTANGIEVVAGRDLLAGGTWFGVAPHVVCGLTNRCDGLGPRRGALSRGSLVVEALERPSVEGIEARLSALDGAAYGPFSLLAIDDEHMLYAANDGPGGTMTLRRVPPGVHVLGNFGLDDEGDPVVATVGPAVRELASADEKNLVLGLEGILARRGAGWPNVHLPDRVAGGYGTRSAGVLLRRKDASRLFTTAGAPDQTPWRDQSQLLVGLLSA